MRLQPRDSVTGLRSLPTTWRERADLLLRHGASEAAHTAAALADELETVLRSEDADVLTLEQAAEVSGFSRDHLTRLVRERKLANVGRRHSPRFRRGDLPRKPGRALPLGVGCGDLADARRRMAATVVHSKSGD